jgi:hypothetical protein
MFLLEPVGIFVDNQKMTSDTGDHIRFWAHRRLARIYFHKHKVLSKRQFDQVDWKSVHPTLHGISRLFQLWASKHVLGVAGTMKFLSHQDDRSPLCPSCGACNESCRHVHVAQRWDEHTLLFNPHERWSNGWKSTIHLQTWHISYLIICAGGETLHALHALPISTYPPCMSHLPNRKKS